MRNALRLIFYRMFLVVVFAGAIMGVLTMQPSYVSVEFADEAYFYITRTGVFCGGAAILLDLWIWFRP